MDGSCFFTCLECFLGATHAVTLSRVYALRKAARARNIDYRHVIHSLVKKPQAFRFFVLRDDLLPTALYRDIWRYIEKNVRGKAACKLMVGLLHLASTHDCETELGVVVQSLIEHDKPLSLSALEANSRLQNKIARHIKESKLPAGKSLATFDFTCTQSINYQQIAALAENPDWVRQANNIVIFGPSGVGKSHLAAAIGYRMIEHGFRCCYTSSTSLVQKLQQAKSVFKLPEFLAKLARFPVLILDDIGYVKKDETETSVLFELIADRYENGTLIITANQPFSEWDSIFPDNMMAVAAVDRLVHHATIINVKEESYRKKGQKISKLNGRD